MANYKKNTRDLSWYSRSTPFAEGSKLRLILPQTETYLPWWPYKNTTKERIGNAEHTSKICEDISLITLLSIRKEHSLEVRRGLSTFENMPFLRVEDALLGARKASSSTLIISYWFIKSYRLYIRRLHPPILHVFFKIHCNDFSQHERYRQKQ